MVDKKEICAKMKISIFIEDDEMFALDVDMKEKYFKGRVKEEFQIMSVIREIYSVDFALYLNEKVKEKGITANKTKLQKLLYICYGSYLKLQEMQPLLDEKPNAWDYGPAFPKVYSAQRSNDKGLNGLPPLSFEKLDYFKQFDDLIYSVLDFFGDWTTDQLINLTHEEGTAWHKKYSEEKYAPLNDLDIFMDFRGYMT